MSLVESRVERFYCDDLVVVCSEAEKKADKSYKVSLDDVREEREGAGPEESTEEPTGPPFGIVLNGHSLVRMPLSTP